MSITSSAMTSLTAALLKKNLSSYSKCLVPTILCLLVRLWFIYVMEITEHHNSQGLTSCCVNVSKTCFNDKNPSISPTNFPASYHSNIFLSFSLGYNWAICGKMTGKCPAQTFSSANFNKGQMIILKNRHTVPFCKQVFHLVLQHSIFVS